MNRPHGMDPRMTLGEKWADGHLVTYPVSCAYNGGPAEVVEPPVQAPPGYRLVDICVGLDYNSRPPRATKLLVKGGAV